MPIFENLGLLNSTIETLPSERQGYFTDGDPRLGTTPVDDGRDGQIQRPPDHWVPLEFVWLAFIVLMILLIAALICSAICGNFPGKTTCCHRYSPNRNESADKKDKRGLLNNVPV